MSKAILKPTDSWLKARILGDWDDSDIYNIADRSLWGFCQEVIHLYQLRSRLSADEFRIFPRNWEYWVITALMIGCSAVGVWILYGEKGVPKSVLFILGAAFPALFKKITAATTGGEIKLGKHKSVWQMYLGSTKTKEDRK